VLNLSVARLLNSRMRDPSPSASLPRKLKKGRTPVSWHESRTLSESLSSRKCGYFHLVTLRAQRSERAGASEALAVRNLAWGSTFRFLGSIYATAGTSIVVFIAGKHLLLPGVFISYGMTREVGQIVSSPYRFTFSRLYMFYMFMSTISYVTMNLSHLFCHIISLLV
jgi:hypothetical protein